MSLPGPVCRQLGGKAAGVKGSIALPVAAAVTFGQAFGGIDPIAPTYHNDGWRAAGRGLGLPPIALSRDAAEGWLRPIVLDSSRVGFADHARAQMVARDISSREVWEVLKGGTIVKGPTWDEAHKDWVCVLRRIVAGRKVQVVVALESEIKMTVVTAYG